jgi:hypothetical protein
LCGLRCGFAGSLRSLQFFQLELKLLKLRRLLLALAAEDHPPVLLDDQLQVFDQLQARIKLQLLCHQRLPMRRVRFQTLHAFRNQQLLQRFDVELIEVSKSGNNHARSMP